MKCLSRSRELLAAIQTASLGFGCSAAASQPAGMQPWKTAASLGVLDVEQVTELESAGMIHQTHPIVLFLPHYL